MDKLVSVRSSSDPSTDPKKSAKVKTKPKSNYRNTYLHEHEIYIYGDVTQFGGIGNCLRYKLPDISVSQVSCGQNWAAVLTSSNTVFTWGCNSEGQLGHGNDLPQNQPKLVDFFSKMRISQVSCGSLHGGFLTSEGDMYMTGCNTYGRLGVGDIHTVKHFTPIKLVLNYETLYNADDSSIFGLLSPKKNVNSNGGVEVKFTQVSCGDRHSLFLTSEAHKKQNSNLGLPNVLLLSCGDGGNGRLGLDDDEDRAIPQIVKIFRTEEEVITPIIVRISAGYAHSAAICSEGFIYTWGNGGNGRLGHNSSESEWTPRRIESFNLMKKKNIASEFQLVSCGLRHSIALNKNGELYSWGKGTSGLLGMPVLKDSLIPMRLHILKANKNGEESPIISKSVSAGKYHSATVDANLNLFIWGESSVKNATLQYKATPQVFTPENITPPSPKRETLPPPDVLYAMCGEAFSLFVVQQIPPGGNDSKNFTSFNLETISTVMKSKAKFRNIRNLDDEIIADSDSCEFDNDIQIDDKIHIKLDGDLSEKDIPSCERKYLKMILKVEENARPAFLPSFHKTPGVDINTKNNNRKKSSTAKPINEAAPNQHQQLEFKSITGIDNWLKHHSQHQKMNDFKGCKFAKSKRFTYKDATTSVSEFQTSNVDLTEKLPKRTFSLSPRNTNNVDKIDVPGPADYNPTWSNCSYKFTFPTSPRKTLSLKNTQNNEIEQVLVPPNQGIYAVYPRPPSYSIGNGDHFSQIIAKKLQEGKGVPPGPGDYL